MWFRQKKAYRKNNPLNDIWMQMSPIYSGFAKHVSGLSGLKVTLRADFIVSYLLTKFKFRSCLF